MENLRWILIFAGVAILVLLYFSGRGASGANARNRPTRPGRARRDDYDASLDGSDPLLGQATHHTNNVEGGFDGFDHVDPEDLERPGVAAHRKPDYESEYTLDHGHEHARQPTPARSFNQASRDDYLPPELQDDQPRSAGLGSTAAEALGGLSQKIDAIGARLSGKRRERVAANPPPQSDSEAPVYASKIITLHVVAQGDTVFDGETLVKIFAQRDYTFGEMNIFHSMHHDKTVFSVAKMVEPGWFDPDDMSSFSTPGITLILQLPGPVAADTAFEVLLSEAFEIANELGGSVLDGDRSTLSKQTAQHMREGIYEYMHRQKYFGSVAS